MANSMMLMFLLLLQGSSLATGIRVKKKVGLRAPTQIPQHVVVLSVDDDESTDERKMSFDLHRKPSERQQQIDGVVFKKHTKTASELLKKIVQRVISVPAGNKEKIPEYDALLKEDVHNKFVIASTRNPCNWLLSLWSFASEKKEGSNWFKWCDKETHGPFSQTLDKDVFKEWVFKHPGLVTYRFAKSYTQDESGHVDPDKYYCNWKPTEKAKQSLMDVDLSYIDCMVVTETFTSDARSCMHKAEKKGLFVDWRKFDKLLSLHIHETHHGSCSDYFDTELTDFVKKSESVAFKKFGFTTCCGPSSP